MNLTKKDRLSLVNQYLILEKLYPEDADYYAKTRKIFEEGYTLHYDDAFRGLDDELSEDDCSFVIDTLDMYDALQHAYKRLSDRSNIDENRLKFPGFDGNNESQYLAYARFFIEDLGRFEDLDMYGFNSHMPSIDRYRRMIAAWNSSSDRYSLTKDDIERIINS